MMKRMGKYTYPLVFGTFLAVLSTTFAYRNHLLPQPDAMKVEADKFFNEDKDTRSVLKQTIQEMRA